MAKRDGKKRPRRMSPNPLSKGGKIALLGGVAVVGGAAAFFLTRGGPPPQSEGQVDPAAAAAAAQQQCAQLQNQLKAIRLRPSANADDVRRAEVAVRDCLAQLRGAGAPVDAAASEMSKGDDKQAFVDAKFSEMKTTDYVDWLKRNTLRREILEGGEALTSAYNAAIAAAADDVTVAVIRRSILRSIGSSIDRRRCYFSRAKGCDRSGPAEDGSNEKTQQEASRVTAPLIAAFASATDKLGGPGSERVLRGGDGFVTVLAGACRYLAESINWEFDHYKATDYSDALSRNNTRQTILASGAALAVQLGDLYNLALKYKDLAGMSEVAYIANAAMNDAITRQICYFTDAKGCGRLGVNEDHGNDKAQQESSAVIEPIAAVAIKADRAMAAAGNATYLGNFFGMRLRQCTMIKDSIDAEFNHYKATSYSDALKRNNTRATMLASGAALAACLDKTLTAVLDAAKDLPAPKQPAATAQQKIKLASLDPRALSPFASLQKLSGLGQGGGFTSVLSPSVLSSLRTGMAAGAAYAAGLAVSSVQQVANLTLASIDAAVNRRLCYLYDQPGCGRFGVNEDHGNDKAAQEQERVINPLIAVYKRAAGFLASNGSPGAELQLTQILLREASIAASALDQKFAEYKSVSYIDPLRRNNIRNDVLALGRRLVDALRAAKPETAASKDAVRKIAQSAIASSKLREQCFRSKASGCDKSGELEPNEKVKADEEARTVSGPLSAMLSDKSALGQTSTGASSGSAMPILAVAAVGAFIWYMHSQSAASRPAPSRNRRRRI